MAKEIETKHSGNNTGSIPLSSDGARMNSLLTDEVTESTSSVSTDDDSDSMTTSSTDEDTHNSLKTKSPEE
nr:hypothetical transcript [Hymenolepis microstoma]